MSSHHQLQPLTIDEESNEPYLRLPDPHSHIIITPFRLQDALDIVPILNDERVYKWMTGPPYPYLLEDAEAWITMMKEKSDKLVETLGKAPGLEELQLVDGCPVHTLREVKEDGKQVFLGDISFIRCRWDDLDADQRKKLVDENESRVPGDPELIWSVGDYIKPSHQGQGIMTAALATLMRTWCIPTMGMHQMRVNVLIGNGGSVRVLRRMGLF